MTIKFETSFGSYLKVLKILCNKQLYKKKKTNKEIASFTDLNNIVHFSFISNIQMEKKKSIYWFCPYLICAKLIKYQMLLFLTLCICSVGLLDKYF